MTASYSQLLADWDQLAQAQREAEREAAARSAEAEAAEPEDDLFQLIDPCPSFAGLAVDFGAPVTRSGSAQDSLDRIAAALPALAAQFDAQLLEVLDLTRDVIREVYAKTFHMNLPTILDNNLAGLVTQLRKTTVDALQIEVRMTCDDTDALERRLARHRNDTVSLAMIPSSKPGHCTATVTWPNGVIAFDASILARGIEEIFTDPEVLPAPPKAMRAATHWDPH